MAITDQLVKLMNGEIVVKSIPGEGSDFSVFLHLPVAEGTVPAEQIEKENTAEEAESEEIEVFRGRRILVAEDNEINAMVAREILGQMGARNRCGRERDRGLLKCLTRSRKIITISF